MSSPAPRPRSCGNRGLAGRTADSHDDQIVMPEAPLAQDGIFGGDIEPQDRSDRCAIAVRQFDDVLENGFFVAPTRGRPP